MIFTKKTLNKALITLSVIINTLFLLLILFALNMKTAALAYYRMGSKEDPYVTAAFVISVPSGTADVVFNQADFSLPVGSEASLQFSIRKDGQLNMALDPLYDHDVISAERSGYGLIIKALAPGKTILQTFGQAGFKNIAEITVTSND